MTAETKTPPWTLTKPERVQLQEMVCDALGSDPEDCSTFVTGTGLSGWQSAGNVVVAIAGMIESLTQEAVTDARADERRKVLEEAEAIADAIVSVAGVNTTDCEATALKIGDAIRSLAQPSQENADE